MPDIIKNNIRSWIHGLGAAFIGGSASAITSVVITPEILQWDDGMKRLLKGALIAGFLTAAAYLKKSPLPEVIVDKVDKTP
jgi:hypothetical protein